MEYDNTNRGALFKNNRKEKDSQPDYNGSINVNGVEYWLLGWLKEGQKGKFFSLSVQPKERQEQPKQAPDKSGQWKAGAQRQAPTPNRGGFDDMDDDGIPFRDPLSYRGNHLVI